MWVKIAKEELEASQKKRVAKANMVFAVFSIFYVWIFIEFIGSFAELVEIYQKDPEICFLLVLAPLIGWLTYSSYVSHGSVVERPSKMCLHCERGMGGGDDGWGFKVYGRSQNSWYQVQACDTPEKCDIVYMHEVRWVQDDSYNQ